MARDITERKEFEERLKEYKKAVEGSEDLVAALDENKKYIFANQNYLDFHEINDERKIVGKSVSDFYGGKELERINEKVEKTLTGKRVQYEMKRKNEETKYFNTKYYPLKENNQTTGVVKLLEDITKRKEFEKRLKLFKRALESSRDMIAIVDEDYKYKFANNAFLDFHNLDSGDVINKSIKEVVGEKEFEKNIKSNVDKCLNDEIIQYQMKHQIKEE